MGGYRLLLNGRFPAPAGRCVTSTPFGQYGIIRKEAEVTTALEPVRCRSGLTVTAPGRPVLPGVRPELLGRGDADRGPDP